MIIHYYRVHVWGSNNNFLRLVDQYIIRTRKQKNLNCLLCMSLGKLTNLCNKNYLLEITISLKISTHIYNQILRYYENYFINFCLSLHSFYCKYQRPQHSTETCH